MSKLLKKLTYFARVPGTQIIPMHSDVKATIIMMDKADYTLLLGGKFK